MAHRSNRREFIRDLGIGAAALPFILNLPSLGFANQTRRKQRLVVMFSPNGVVPKAFWPDEEGPSFKFKESLKPLEPYHDRTLDPPRSLRQAEGRRRQPHARHGLLVDGDRALPRQHPGWLRHAGGMGQGAVDRSGDQERTAELSRKRAPGSARLEFGVMVPDRADTWSRMVYAGANKPIAPIDDPYQMFAKLYGRMKDQESLKSILDDLQDDLHKVGSVVSVEDRHLLEEHATFVREMEQELQDNRKQDVGHAVPELEPGVKHENAHMPKISKMQIDLMVDSFASDFARVATLQFTNSVGGARMSWIGVTEGHHELSHHPDSDLKSQEKLTKINKWYCEQMAYLAKRLAETPEPGGGGSLLDNTMIVWTNELGKGNSHTLNDIPFVMVGNGLDFKMGRSLKYKKVAHNRLLLAWPTAWAITSNGSATPTSAVKAFCRI